MFDDKLSWQRGAEATPVSEARVAQILARADLKLEAFEPLSGGLSNTLLRVRSADGLDLVLRIHRDESLCAKEVAISRLIGDRVPLPEILYADPSEPCVLLRFVEGETLRQLKSRGADLSVAARSIGETLAAISTITFERPGFFGPDLSIAPEPPSVVSFMEECLRTARHLDPALRAAISQHLTRYTSQLDAVSAERSLVHSDFGAANILLDTRGAVAAILDWEFAFSGSTLFDIGNFLRYERSTTPRLEPHFSAGFVAAGGHLPENWRSLARAIDLTALCEFLTRPTLPDSVVPEILELITATIEHRDYRAG